MNPIWFEVTWGDTTWPIRAYAAMHVIAAIVALVLGTLSLRAACGWWRGLVIVATFLVSLEFASRYAYLALTAIGPLQTSVSGMWLPAGIAAALLTLALTSRVLTCDPWQIADRMAPAVYLGGAIMRLGCWMRGCCFGHPTQLAWGVRFPIGSPAHLHQGELDFMQLLLGPMPVHPTQALEAIACLILAAVGTLMLFLRVPRGAVALSCGSLFAINRAVITMLRVSDPRMPPWTQSAWLPAILGLGLGIGALCVLGGYLRRSAAIRTESDSAP